MVIQYLVMCAAMFLEHDCLGCYINITTINSGDVHWGTNPSTISNYYTPLIGYGVNPSIQSVWYFEVKACQDACILLTTNQNLAGPLLEIIIGSYWNERITVQTGPGTQTNYFTGTLLNCGSYAKFWLSWTQDGIVSLGSGDNKCSNEHFNTTLSPTTTFGGIGIMTTYNDAGGEWRFCPSSPEPVPDGCPTDQSTQTARTTALSTAESTLDDITKEAITTNTSPLTASSGITTATKSSRMTTLSPPVNKLSTTEVGSSTATENETPDTLGTSVQTSVNNASYNSYSGSATCSPCECSCADNPENTTDEIIKQEDVAYKVDKTKLSAYKRKLTSAADPRKSAMYIGVCGVSVISICVLFS